MSDPTAINIEFDPTQQRMTGRTYHKNMYFDVPYISEVIPNLYQGGCKDGLILPTNIQHLVSLYPWEQYRQYHELKSSLTVRMYDDPNESMDKVLPIVYWVHDKVDQGEDVLVHCQAGLNRSGLVAALVLRMQGFTPEAAIAELRERRSPACLCNSGFEKYVREVEL